ncbi:MAG: aminoglycoside phosphotransferase family protein, partial [Rhodobacterales bacterium]|nr:aminoglycoside phosphotransferase family protein [Rhodobacterales bacterium]
MPPASLVQDLARAALVPLDATWSRLHGGRTNQVWRVRAADMDRVVKLYARDAGTPLFPNDPQAEALVLGALSATGLSPRPVDNGTFPAGTVLVYEHQDGHAWRSDTKPVARTLKALHAVPISGCLSRLPPAPDGSAALAAQTRAILAQVPPNLAAPLLAAQPRGVVPPSGRRVLLHGDPVPGNLICSFDQPRDPPVLVDWQCPMLGDPALDLALFLSPAMQQVGRASVLSREEKQSFLDAYDDRATAERLAALQPFLHW